MLFQIFSYMSYHLPKKLINGRKTKALTKEKAAFNKKVIEIQILRNVKLISLFSKKDININWVARGNTQQVQ